MKLKPAAFAVVALLLFPCSANLHAQTRNRNRAPVARPSQPVSTQTAITKDGRTVILKSDGTWEYTSDPPNPTTPSPSAPLPSEQNSVLSLEAGLVYKSGDTKPVARTTFYLLDDELGKILREAGLQPEASHQRIYNDVDRALVSTFASSIKFRILPQYQAFYPAAMEALKPHIIQSVTTDFGGKASFEPVPPKVYYLMGFNETPRGYAIWNLKVDLKPGQNSVTLDQNNAAYAR